jgi:hypothetical protein
LSNRPTCRRDERDLNHGPLPLTLSRRERAIELRDLWPFETISTGRGRRDASGEGS